MPFLTLSVSAYRLSQPLPTNGQVCIERTSIAALGWLAWTAFFLFLFQFFASYCPSFSPFFLTFHHPWPICGGRANANCLWSRLSSSFFTFLFFSKPAGLPLFLLHTHPLHNRQFISLSFYSY
uniref:Candidate secreted effector n=1 Tax=Meloidogyne incognita TaxID=6306 RepID=A0A914M8X3_MELIC